MLEGLEAIDFVVSLEARASLVTERANVVFPVSLIQERAGTFVNWEGRHRPFDVVILSPTGCPTCGCWRPWPMDWADLGFRTAAQARAELDEIGVWEGERGEAPTTRPWLAGRAR